jgi:hypothetical protein
VPPRLPLQIVDIDIYRDGGTGYMIVKDASGRRYPFCFDKFLGRLCTGRHTSDDDAAYVTTGSDLEAAVFTLMAATIENLSQHPRPHERRHLAQLRRIFDQARPLRVDTECTLTLGTRDRWSDDHPSVEHQRALRCNSLGVCPEIHDDRSS